MIVLWSYTPVILCKADLHVYNIYFFFVTTDFGNRAYSYECIFQGALHFCVSSMIDELYGELLHSLKIISGYYNQHVACSFMLGALAFVL